MCPW
jgi:hypothetical protein